MIPAGPGSNLTSTDMLWTREAGGLYTAVVPGGRLSAIVTHEPAGWHLSVAFTGPVLRLPSWDELKDARYRFVPDRAVMAALLPPRAEWVDIHPTCLHLWEVPADVGRD